MRLTTLAAILASLCLSLAAAPVLASGSTGGVSPTSSSKPPSAAGTGGSQAGKVPARIARAVLARAARTLGHPTLRRGARGRPVKTLQQVLSALRYGVRATGYFGSTTERQVKRFQAAWHLPVVGFVGPATGAALRSALAGGKPSAKPAKPVAPVVSTDGWAFPVRGPHSYGDDMDRYGAPRSGHTHQGQDILASCGTPLVALRGGTVIDAGYGGSAGNYIAVHSADTRYDYFYAHLRSQPLVHAGDTVHTGQGVGEVGDTGDAVGCHLHIELWDGAWWGGGHTVDPLPFLKAWDH